MVCGVSVRESGVDSGTRVSEVGVVSGARVRQTGADSKVDTTEDKVDGVVAIIDDDTLSAGEEDSEIRLLLTLAEETRHMASVALGMTVRSTNLLSCTEAHLLEMVDMWLSRVRNVF